MELIVLTQSEADKFNAKKELIKPQLEAQNVDYVLIQLLDGDWVFAKECMDDPKCGPLMGVLKPLKILDNIREVARSEFPQPL